MREPQSPEGYDTPGYNTPPEGCYIPDVFPSDEELMLA